jgi:hypothetical protein
MKDAIIMNVRTYTGVGSAFSVCYDEVRSASDSPLLCYQNLINCLVSHSSFIILSSSYLNLITD